MRQPAHLALTCLLALAATLPAPPAQAKVAEPLQVRIGYLGYRPDPGPLLSNIIPEPADAGLQGAELAIVDSNSSGRFLKQEFQLAKASVDSPEALLQAAKAQHDQGLRLFVVNAPAASLRALSAALPDSLLFNAGSPDDSLRSSQCLGNVLHSLPGRAMLADALAQFLVLRKWQRALLIVGQTDDDRAYAAALRRAMKRFGMQLVAEKAWTFDNDQRRSAQADMPLFTQTPEYHVLLVAAAWLEIVGGALLALGLFTRPVAFILSGQMAVAYFLAHFP
uniref:DoxX family protein n=1 Tax=Pseudomonas sp. TaxID=306 RepID=UPI0031D62A25